MAERVLRLDSATAMEALGAVLARHGLRGQCLYLHGPLAAGKTTLARGYLRALGHAGAVKSPTFTLVESYVLPTATVHHFDLYRLGAAEELEYIGLEDYLDGTADVLVEWAERGASLLPRPALDIVIAIEGGQRVVRCIAAGEAGCTLLTALDLDLKSINCD